MEAKPELQKIGETSHCYVEKATKFSRLEEKLFNC
jgi:hypothetical protein